MKKVLASCAALALFAQFTDAKVAGKPAQDKEKKVEQIDADECNCERDPFAGGYITFGFGYGSTKDKLESDLTLEGTETDIPAAKTRADAQTDATTHKGNVFDTVEITNYEDEAGGTHIATLVAKKNTKKNKSHHNVTGSAGAGWMWKAGSNGYIGLEGSFGFGSDSTTSLQFVDNGNPRDLAHIDLKRKGLNIGVSGILGWKVAQSNLIYGKVGVRSSSVEIVPAKAGSYSKKTFNPEFGVGFKRVNPGSKVALGIEATYSLNKKIKMNDQGKDYTFVDFSGNDGLDEPLLQSMHVSDDADNVSVTEENVRAVVKSKKTGTWKVALTISMPLA